MKITIHQITEKTKVPQLLESLDAALKASETIDQALTIQDLVEWLRKVFRQVGAKENAIMEKNGGVQKPDGTFGFEFSEKEPKAEEGKAAWRLRAEKEMKAKDKKIGASLKTLHSEELTLPESLSLPLVMQIPDDKYLELVKSHANIHVSDFITFERMKKPK